MKKPIFKNIFLLFSCFVLLQISNAQSEKAKAIEILKTVNTTLSNSNSISMKITHKFYNTHADKVPADVYQGFYKRSKLKTHSLIMGIETIENKNMKVAIDTTNNSIIINSLTKSTVPMPDLSSSLSFCSKIAVSNIDSSAKEITLEFESGKFPFEKLIFEVRKNIMTKLVMFHSETVDNEDGKQIKPKTEILFTEVEVNENISSSEFDYSYILLENGKTFKLTSKYNNYKLINLIPQN